MKVTRDLENIHGLALCGILLRIGALFQPIEDALRQVQQLDELGLFDVPDIVQIIGFFEVENHELPAPEPEDA